MIDKLKREWSFNSMKKGKFLRKITKIPHINIFWGFQLSQKTIQ